MTEDLSAEIDLTGFAIGDTLYSDAVGNDLHVNYNCELVDPDLFLSRLSDSQKDLLAKSTKKADWIEDFVQDHVYDQDENGNPERLSNFGAKMLDWNKD